MEKTGNSGSHKVLTCPVFPAKLDTKKPATIEEAGEVLHTEKVEPAGVEPASKQGQLVLSTCLFCNWFLTGG